MLFLKVTNFVHWQPVRYKRCLNMVESASRRCKLFKLEEDNNDTINKLLDILRKEGVIALPTDTLYGVACNAQSTKAIERIYDIKGRNVSKPIAICVGQVEDVFKWGHIPAIFSQIDEDNSQTIEKFPNSIIEDNTLCSGGQARISHAFLEDLLPGPVTIVTKRTEQLNKRLNPGTALVGIRIPDHDFIRKLADRLGFPLALTSANLSSQMSSLCLDDFSALHNKLDAIVDGGTIGTQCSDLSENSRKGSTVLQIFPDGKSFSIIRPGCAYDTTVGILRDKWQMSLLA